MKILISLIVVSLAVLYVESLPWCGYLQCTKDCDENARDKRNCPVCKCTCGLHKEFKCQVGYYCLLSIWSPESDISKYMCCSRVEATGDRICYLAKKTDVARALPHDE